MDRRLATRLDRVLGSLVWLAALLSPASTAWCQTTPTIAVSPATNATVLRNGALTFSITTTSASTVQIQASPSLAGTGTFATAGALIVDLTFVNVGTTTLQFIANGAGGTSSTTVVVNVLASALSTYPTAGDFQWLSKGPDVPSGDWNAPTISDDGIYVAAASNTFSAVSLRFNRTAPSLTYRMVGAPCGISFCPALRPRISGNGRYVVFESNRYYDGTDAPALGNIWVWDSQTGITRRASVPNAGGVPNNPSFAADISRDGGYVSFLSTATNLTPDATFGGTKAFRADMSTVPATVAYVSGPYNTVESARMSSNGGRIVFRADNQLLQRDMAQSAPSFLGWLGHGTDMGDGEHSLTLSPDGRYAAQSILNGASFGVYVFDRLQGDVRSDLLYPANSNIGSIAASSGSGFVASAACSFSNYYNASVWIRARDGSESQLVQTDGPFEACDFGIDITPKGDLIAVSLPPLLTPNLFGQSPFDPQHIFVTKNPLYQPLPANIAQYQGGIPASSTNVKSSADGKVAVFQSEIPAEQLLCFDAESQVYSPGCAPSDSNGQPDVFRYDFDRNAVELISSPDGLVAVGGRNPDIDLRGEAIVFEAADNALPAKVHRDGRAYGVARAGKGNHFAIYLLRLIRGASQRSTNVLTVGRNGEAPDGNSQNPTISPDGHYVGFSTDATNINPGVDQNGVRDVVRVEVESGVVDCVSACPGMVADAPSDYPSVSNSGLVALETKATTLVKEYRSKLGLFTQIVVIEPGLLTTRTISRNAAGQAGSGNSQRPRITAAGNAVVYQSAAPITNDDTNGRIDVYLANLIANTNQRVSRKPPPGGKANPQAPKATAGVEDGDSLRPTISGDGRFIAFQTSATNLVDVDTNNVVDLVVAGVHSGELRRIYQGFGGIETDGASETPHLNNNGTHLGFHSFATNLDEAGDPDTSTSEPYVRSNPSARGVIFFDPFE